jgi:hypothetical protein
MAEAAGEPEAADFKPDALEKRRETACGCSKRYSLGAAAVAAVLLTVSLALGCGLSAACGTRDPLSSSLAPPPPTAAINPALPTASLTLTGFTSATFTAPLHSAFSTGVASLLYAFPAAVSIMPRTVFACQP